MLLCIKCRGTPGTYSDPRLKEIIKRGRYLKQVLQSSNNLRKPHLDIVHCKTFGYFKNIYYYAYSLDPAGPLGFGLFIPSP